MGLSRILRSLFEGRGTDVFTRYEILREAVSGTMSKFYKARDRETDEIVGLKVLDKAKTEIFSARFKGLNKPSEGEIAVALHHPDIVKTFHHGTTLNGEPYLIMEFLDGPGLNSLIIGRDPKLRGNRLTLLRHAAKAIGAVHEAGYIHRDICPRNFVVNPDVTTMTLIDFGLTVPEKSEFMRPGNRTGTPNYMSPEVIRRRPTDHRLDIFSFGVSAYELITSELPWIRGTGGLAAIAHDTNTPIPITDLCPHIHPQLGKAIMRCLARAPEDRPQSAEEFLQMIRRVENELAP